MTAPATNAIDGARIRRLRRERGEDLAQLAEQVGISDVYLSKIERGERIPRNDVRRRLCEALGVDDLTPTDDDTDDDRILIPLQEVARLTGFRYDALVQECRDEKWDHVERNGRRWMTREQIDALIDAHTKKAKPTPASEEAQIIAAHTARIAHQLTRQAQRTSGRNAA